MAPDTVIVLNVLPSGPSDRPGEAGDRIIRINDSLVAGQRCPTTKLSNGYRANAAHRVAIARNGRIVEPVEVEVTRGAIPIKKAAFMLPEPASAILQTLPVSPSPRNNEFDTA